jgi:hypothetical protein
MADTATIIDLLGASDNFDEPQPLWNRSATMIGLTVPFLVRTSDLGIGMESSLTRYIDIFLDMRNISSIYAAEDCSLAGMG